VPFPSGTHKRLWGHSLLECPKIQTVFVSFLAECAEWEPLKRQSFVNGLTWGHMLPIAIP